MNKYKDVQTAAKALQAKNSGRSVSISFSQWTGVLQPWGVFMEAPQENQYCYTQTAETFHEAVNAAENFLLAPHWEEKPSTLTSIPVPADETAAPIYPNPIPGQAPAQP